MDVNRVLSFILCSSLACRTGPQQLAAHFKEEGQAAG
jgi:hypothetical protein